MMMSKEDDAQLRQIRAKSPHPGVWSGDLISKPSARKLVAAGLVRNSGGSPSSLAYLSITAEGEALLRAVDEIDGRN